MPEPLCLAEVRLWHRTVGAVAELDDGQIVFEYDEAAGTLRLTGQGAYLGLAKVFTGGELADPAAAPESVTYEVFELVGDSLTVRISTGGGWWEYRLTRISTSRIAPRSICLRQAASSRPTWRTAPSGSTRPT